MNVGLHDAVRHNVWANREILAACRKLSDDQLRATTEGVYGSIHDILWHIVSSEASYLYRLTGIEPAWDRGTDDAPDLDTIEARIDEIADTWKRFLSEPFDPDQMIVTDGGRFEFPLGVVFAQAIHHGTDHRSQICTILTTLGIEPPELGVWEYALADGRAVRHES